MFHKGPFVRRRFICTRSDNAAKNERSAPTFSFQPTWHGVSRPTCAFSRNRSIHGEYKFRRPEQSTLPKLARARGQTPENQSDPTSKKTLRLQAILGPPEPPEGPEVPLF